MLSADDAGNTNTFASGFRSPAGLAVSPNNEIVYTENQGEFVGTSKVFIVEEGKFYGNPTGLIDIEGMNTESPEVQWEAVRETRELPIALLPHNEVMNAPGSPEFFRDPIKFGPFTGQMLLGDQLQSNLYRIDLQEVDGIRQSVALPFMQGLNSGAMRLRFNPQDSSLWIGQTGRGWRAKGGQKILTSTSKLRLERGCGCYPNGESHATRLRHPLHQSPARNPGFLRDHVPFMVLPRQP